MSDQELPSRIEHLANVISGTGTHAMKAAARSISYRIPVYDLARLDAMASVAGKSRNAMLNLVVSAGLDEVWKLLPKNVQKQVSKVEFENHQAVFSEAAESIEE